MGKPYQNELSVLAATYDAALSSDISGVARFLTDARPHPLIAIGSGGSFSAAHLAASLHERFAGRLSRASTPLDAVDSVSQSREDTAVLLLSAGGSNPDVTGAFRILAETEPAKLAVICGQSQSPLTKLAAAYSYVDVHTFKPPSGRDGFLATNSLLYFGVLLLRGYLAAGGSSHQLPRDLKGLLHPSTTSACFIHELAHRCEKLWSRPTLIVLFGPETSSAAVDIESKFTEAALGSVQISDFRNFAHGRHHWLAKHGNHTSVLALVTARDRILASRTLQLLPRSIPRTSIHVPASDGEAALAALVVAFHVAGLAGTARGIDPGRPGVPAFGRKIYNLRTFHLRDRSTAHFASHQTIAIERKAKASIELLKVRGDWKYWVQAYRKFARRLNAAQIKAVVLDYDGTLCETRERKDGIRAECAAELNRLIEAGILIGVVTGRGRSVRKDLRRELPATAWERVLVGYYNGSDIASLADDTRPDAGASKDCLAEIARKLQTVSALARLCEVDCRPSQISVTAKPGISMSVLWEVLKCATCYDSNITVVRSGHSFDILAPGISKTTLLRRLSVDGNAILSIGDRGCWPGNDFKLLQHPLSLSAHEVSSNPDACWNLAPAGQRGVAATLYYLRSLHGGRKGAGMLLSLPGHRETSKT